ncbi:hypothetical protein ABEF95_004049 [Exophiala dermatitidis]
MDDPVAEIPRIIRTLCIAPPALQRATIETYFTPSASFTHPFCRTGSFAGSIWLIIMIYRWYKILSPHIDIWVDSVAFDKENLLLYVSIRQNFKLWIVPFYNAPVKLVTVLQLTTAPEQPPPPLPGPLELVLRKVGGTTNGSARNRRATRNGINGGSSSDSSSTTQDGGQQQYYYIQSQNDLYQTSEWIKFLVPWGIGVFLVVVWQFSATIACVVGTKVFDFLTWVPKRLYRAHFEVFDNDKRVFGAD